MQRIATAAVLIASSANAVKWNWQEQPDAASQSVSTAEGTVEGTMLAQKAADEVLAAGIAQKDSAALQAALLQSQCQSALEFEVTMFARCAHAAADSYTEGQYDAWLDAYHSCSSEVDAFMTPLKVDGGECALQFKTAPPAEDLAKMRQAEAAAKKRAETTLAERDTAVALNKDQQKKLLSVVKRAEDLRTKENAVALKKQQAAETING